MSLHLKQFGIVLKNARMDKKLTQAELAEILDISLPYLKDLERFRNNPSLEVFAKVIHYFNLSADTVIYPNKNLTDGTYQKIVRLLTRCDEGQLQVILSTTEALLSVSEKQVNKWTWYHDRSFATLLRVFKLIYAFLSKEYLNWEIDFSLVWRLITNI